VEGKKKKKEEEDEEEGKKKKEEEEEEEEEEPRVLEIRTHCHNGSYCSTQPGVVLLRPAKRCLRGIVAWHKIQ